MGSADELETPLRLIEPVPEVLRELAARLPLPIPPNTALLTLRGLVREARYGRKSVPRRRRPAISQWMVKEFDPPLDPQIAPAVIAVRNGGIETFESRDGAAGPE